MSGGRRWRMSRVASLLALTAYFVLTASNNGSPVEPTLSRFEFVQPRMGTLFRIICYAPGADVAARASNAAFERIAKLDDIMSDYRPASELMLLCQRSGGPPIEVSEDLFNILAQSQMLAERSDGAFDITVGPVVQLWRRARRRREMPDPQRLAQALELVGCDKIQLDETTRSVRLTTKGMLLDLGGIAKGYAAGEALKVLKRRGIESALVAAGGDIAVSAPPTGKRGWNIGISWPESSGKPPRRFLLLRDAAVSTSGDAEQYVEIGGKRYSHIVDPKTGTGLLDRSSVTVIAPNGAASDGLATAVSVLGPEKGLALIDATEGTAALILQLTEQGLRSFCSKRWKDKEIAECGMGNAE
jgi:FAD:protein FMN transferase